MWGRAALALWLPFTDCAHRPSALRPDPVASLIGANEAAVVAAFGPPTTAFAQGPLRVLVYDRTAVERVPRPSMLRPSLRPIPGEATLGPHGFGAAEFPCRITFTLEAGHVRSFDRRGSGCS